MPPDKPALVPPDISYYPSDRIPPEATWDDLAATAPDLAADVRSAVDDVAGEWFAKQDELLLVDYLAAGARQVWLLDARQRTIEVRRQGGTVLRLGADDWLDGEDILPGFRVAVADLFRPPTR